MFWCNFQYLKSYCCFVKNWRLYVYAFLSGSWEEKGLQRGWIFAVLKLVLSARPWDVQSGRGPLLASCGEWLGLEIKNSRCFSFKNNPRSGIIVSLSCILKDSGSWCCQRLDRAGSAWSGGYSPVDAWGDLTSQHQTGRTFTVNFNVDGVHFSLQLWKNTFITVGHGALGHRALRTLSWWSQRSRRRIRSELVHHLLWLVLKAVSEFPVSGRAMKSTF